MTKPTTKSQQPAVEPTATTMESWLEEYGSILYKFAVLRVGDSHLAEDLVQETLLKAISSYAGFRKESSVLTWLFRDSAKRNQPPAPIEADPNPTGG